ncbi:Disease resistance family protein [Rhynchospora pubera]|uniref:Disease resistance family protein n=1 Tax=Rhynchospora pubera TaxID=906938 RepID=A0AAV8C6V7_9POAL|nr:Disease resistance family protein [Rhynchospora pubera]
MAESIVKYVLDKLADATVRELLNLCGVDKQVKLVSDELSWIRAFLKDADRKSNSGDERQRHWVKEIREVAYDIEDAIDKACLLGIEMENPKKKLSKMEAFTRMFKSPKKLPALHELGVELNEILERIKKISESREKYGTDNIGEGNRSQTELRVRQLLVPDFDDPDVIGFEQHRNNIVTQLLDESAKRRCVISIVGPGGLGKTTLARKAYNSCDVKRKFHLRIWVAISQKFNLVNTLIKLVEAIQGPVNPINQGQQEEYFHRELYKSLLEKKYLVVLDDVWTTNLWIQIKEAFPDTKNGSRVLMTTRSLDVAKSVDSPLEPYKLSYLTEGPSLDLLLKKAFPYQVPDKNYPNNLFDLAKEFVKKCGGLPLALVVLGGLLSKQQPNEHSWRKVMQKMNWRADASEVLAWSYDDLSLALKSCFIYFALFPEDYEINARALIRMWVAEGFVPHDENGVKSEDIAENFLEDLVQRCMVQVSQRSRNGSIKHCHMHDLLHDIAIRKAEADNFLTVFSNPDDQKNCSGARRVALHHRNCEELMKDASPNLRSLVCFNGIPNISRHRQLKVLSDMGISWQAPKEDEFENWATVRYLQLTKEYYFNDFVRSKSKSFLQTLDLRPIEHGDLPDCIWHIKTLRHVLLSWKYSSGPPPLVDMRNLQTLGGVKPRLSWIDQGLPNLPWLRELYMEVVNGFPWQLVVTFISTLKHLDTLTIDGTKREQEKEISNTWKHICFNQECYSWADYVI